MFLRIFVFVLIAANGLFYAWSHSHLSAWGLAKPSQSEPHRITDQIEPERIVIRPSNNATNIAAPTPAASAPAPAPAPAVPTVTAALTPNPNPNPIPTTPAPAPTSCLTAGVFNGPQSNALKQALDAKLPDLRWRFDTISLPARWIVYMGKYANNDQRDQKKKQLDQIKVRYEVLTETNLEPGLSLGSHPSQAAANQALQQLIKQGVRTARVLQESPEQKGQTLMIPTINDLSRAKLNTVYASLATQLANKPLSACKN
jgi:hypothetical protein